MENHKKEIIEDHQVDESNEGGTTTTLNIALITKRVIDGSTFIQNELQHIYGAGETSNFKLGEYLYFAKGVLKKNRNLPGTYWEDAKKGDTSNWQVVSLGYAYKIDYAIKCGFRFLLLANLGTNLVFTHVSKVKVGELETSKRFPIVLV